jgi:hypothetical protein
MSPDCEPGHTPALLRAAIVDAGGEVPVRAGKRGRRRTAA